MTAHALTDPNAAPESPEVWDETRLASLLADVGEAGLRDILRLFMADMPFLQSHFVQATAAADADKARAMLSTVVDSAEALGLPALAALARRMREDPLAPANPGLLAHEVARIRFVPSLKHAS